MQIHKNKYMDFIHIDDFLKIVHHVIDNATDKVIDCVYKEKYTLSEIAQYINTLDEYSVEILTKELDADYVGICTLDLPYIGLLESIKRVYNEIKFSNW
jgi:nucleoside-diphosphate-sugar epimerase